MTLFKCVCPDFVVSKSSVSLFAKKDIRFGSMPRDNGCLILSPEERLELLNLDAAAEPYIRPYFGAQELLHIIPARQQAMRYCLWLKDVKLPQLALHPHIMKRVQACREYRAASKAASTRHFANTPHLFCQIAQNGNEPCLLVPRVSSERRSYVPIGFLRAGCIVSDAAFLVPEATLYDFAIVTSRMHMAWMKRVCGRLEMRYRYSRDLCYNTFYWPEDVSEQQKEKIEAAAHVVLNVRKQYNDYSLATLYNPETMPYELLQAHRKLDAAVEKAYGRKFADDAERVAFLFKKYSELTAEKYQ